MGLWLRMVVTALVAAILTAATLLSMYWAGVRQPDPATVSAIVATVVVTLGAVWAAQTRGGDHSSLKAPPILGYISRLGDHGAVDIERITPGDWPMGRNAATCRIVVPEGYTNVGRLHARLTCDHSSCRVQGQHYGDTFVNDQLVPEPSERALVDGDVISLGGPHGSVPAPCMYMFTLQPLRLPPPAATDPKTWRETTTVLLVPAGSAQERGPDLDRDVRAIDQAVLAARNRGQVALQSAPIRDLCELERELIRHRPAIVHFSGGHRASGRVHLSGDGPETAPASAIGRLFENAPTVRCVVLNACYTREQGRLIASHVACVVGSPVTIGDDAAAAFCVAFYWALASGLSIGEAFRRGETAARRRYGFGKHQAPVLIAAHRADRLTFTM